MSSVTHQAAANSSHTAGQEQTHLAAAPYWGFPVSDELYQRLKGTLSEVQQDDMDVKRLNKALADDVYELVKEGLQAYYHAPTRIIPMSSSKQSAIDKGVKIISGAIKLVINQFFGSLDKPRLKSVATYIENLLWPQDGDQQARLIFQLDPELHRELSRHLERVRDENFAAQEVSHLIARLQQIVDVCILHYYKKPAEVVQLGGLSRSVTDLGIRNVKKAFDSFLERLLSKLDQKDLTKLSVHLESLLYEQPQRHAMH